MRTLAESGQPSDRRRQKWRPRRPARCLWL